MVLSRWSFSLLNICISICYLEILINRMKSNTFKIYQVLSAVTHIQKSYTHKQKSQDLTVNKKCKIFSITNFIKRKGWSTKSYRVHLHKLQCALLNPNPAYSQHCWQPWLRPGMEHRRGVGATHHSWHSTALNVSLNERWMHKGWIQFGVRIPNSRSS